MAEYIEREALLAAYDAVHEGPPGAARKLIADAPAVDVVPYASWFATAKQGTGVSKGQMKCTECAHYKECRSKRDLRRKYSKCPLATGGRFLTNADRVRMMSDEELAKFIADKIPHGDCYGCPWLYSCFCDSDSCSKNFLDWLKQPYKEAQNES